MKKILYWMGKVVFGGMLGLLFCIGCRSAKVEPPEGVPELSVSTVPTVTLAVVTVDVFSGRPNPQWTLTNSQIERIEEVVESLPSIKPFELSSALGYRGFVLELPELNGKQDVFIYVGAGMVLYETEQEKQYLQDVDYQFERQLLHWSQLHLEPTLYETIKKEFERLIGGE